MGGNDPIRLLIVDDEAVVRESLGGWFREEGFAVQVAASGKEALEKAAAAPWDLFILDIKMPGMDGIELQRRLIDHRPGADIVIMTAYASIETAVQAMKQGAHDYLVKPFEPEALERLVRGAAERKRRKAAAEGGGAPEAEEEKPVEILGSSPAIEAVRKMVDSIAPTPSPVLLRGEPGTGKRLVARTIHSRSPRRFLPFVTVHGEGLADAAEGELAGYGKGALAGARCPRKGKLEVAHGGTLFIDEVAGLDGKAQAIILGALDDGKVIPLGEGDPIDVDVRPIAATCRDIDALAAAGTFRRDLLARLEPVTIRLPPLRERRGDIPVLAARFLERHARCLARPVPALGREAVDLLLAHSWPGNVRELECAIERAVLAASGEEIGAADLPIGPAAPGAGGTDERRAIEEAIAEARGNLPRAARLLRMDSAELYLKMKSLGIEKR